MAKKKQGGATGNFNTSAFSREVQRKVSTNQQISHYANALFTNLLAQKQENFDVTYLDLQSRFDTTEWKGILRDMSQNRHTVNYGTIQMEAFSLQELENLQLWKFDASDPNFPLKVEQAIVQYLKTEFPRSLSPAIKSDFEDAIKYHNTNLMDLLSTIRNFSDQINDEKQKSVYQKRSQNFILPFSKIIAHLEASGEDLSGFKTQEFSSWTEDQQKFADTFVSKTLLSRLDKRVQEAKNLTWGVKDVFDKVAPPLRTLFSKYPCDVSTLIQKFPIEATPIYEIEHKLGGEQDELQIQEFYRQRDHIIWQLYLLDLQTKNADLALHFSELVKSDFDFSKLTRPADFFKLIAESRYEQMENQNILELFGKEHFAFKKFFFDLFDLNASELHLDGYAIPIKKTIVSGYHSHLHSFLELELYDELPLEYELDLKNVPFSVEDRAVLEQFFADKLGEGQNTLKIGNRDIGRLIFLFKMGEDSLFDTYDPQKVKGRLGDFFSNLDNDVEIERKKRELKQAQDQDREDDNPQLTNDSKEKSPEDQRKAFYGFWKALSGMQGVAPDFGFKKGAQLYFAMQESELPPYENTGNEWIKMEIVSIDEASGTFKARISGAEREIKGEKSKERGPFPMDAERLKEKFGKSGGNLLSEAQKVTKQYGNFNEQLKAFQQAGICDDKVLGGAEFKNGKFMIEPENLDGTKGKEQEATYFGISDMVPDAKSSKIKKYNILYKVTPNTDHTITVESEFVHHDGGSRSYKHKMTYSDFLFFLKEKNLTPKTAQQAEEEQKASQDVISSTRRKRNFTSIHSIIYGIKNIWKNLNSKLDEYQKEQDEAFLDYLVSDAGIYKILGDTLGFIPSIKDAANKLHEDVMLKKEGKIRKSIEGWISKFKSMQDYANLFEKGFDHPNGYTLDAIIGKGNTLQKIVLSGKSVIDNDELRPIMAAAMIANLRQGKGLYRGLPGKDNQGLRIKCLLGDAHYARYRKMRADVLNQIKRGVKNADQLQDQLKKSEVEYIVNNIRNSNGTEGAFGSVDDGNQQILKQLYSDKFAGELESAANEMGGKSAVEGAYGKIGHNNFAIASNDFKRFIKSGRIESALGNLKKMGDLAKTQEQQRQLKVAMTYVMVSGVMNRYGDKATRKWFDALARTYMLPTAFFAKKWENQKYSLHLLDKIFPKPDKRNFSLATGYKLADFDENSSNIPYGKLLDNLDIWRREHREDIDKYFKALKGIDCGDDAILKAIQDKMREKNEDNLDGDWAGNSGITGHYAILASPSTVGRNKSYDRSGFTGKDVDEKNDKADFWKEVLKDLKGISKRPNGPEFLLKQFVTWFVPSEGEYADMISWIRTANAVKNYGIRKALHIPTHNPEPGAQQWVSSQSGYKSRDHADLLRYLFKGKVLRGNSALPPNEFEAVLDFFYNYFSTNLPYIASDKVLGEVFGSSVIKENASRPTTLIPWDEYNKYVDKNNPFGQNNNQKGDKSAQWKRRFYRSELFMNDKLVSLEKEMNRIGISGIPWLSGVDDDLAYQTHQEIYGNVA